jgi:hypothetical protein
VAFLLTLLTGCDGAGGARIAADMPRAQELPQDIKTCLLALYGPPPAAGMDERETALYIAGFNRHDLAKTQCGRRAIAWGEAQ